MKKLLYISAAAALAISLNSCLLLPGLTVTGPIFDTNYELTTGERVVCKNKTTFITTGFNYRGSNLKSWTLTLERQNGGIIAQATGKPGDTNISDDGKLVRFTFTLAPFTISSLLKDQISASSIIVVPNPPPVTSGFAFVSDGPKLTLRLSVVSVDGNSGTIERRDIVSGTCTNI